LSDDIWDEVTVAVSSFKFRPAQGGGRPVTENAMIRVRLVPAPEGEER